MEKLKYRGKIKRYGHNSFIFMLREEYLQIAGEKPEVVAAAGNGKKQVLEGKVSI